MQAPAKASRSEARHAKAKVNVPETVSPSSPFYPPLFPLAWYCNRRVKSVLIVGRPIELVVGLGSTVRAIAYTYTVRGSVYIVCINHNIQWCTVCSTHHCAVLPCMWFVADSLWRRLDNMMQSHWCHMIRSYDLHYSHLLNVTYINKKPFYCLWYNKEVVFISFFWF